MRYSMENPPHPSLVTPTSRYHVTGIQADVVAQIEMSQHAKGPVAAAMLAAAGITPKPKETT